MFSSGIAKGEASIIRQGPIGQELWREVTDKDSPCSELPLVRLLLPGPGVALRRSAQVFQRGEKALL